VEIFAQYGIAGIEAGILFYVIRSSATSQKALIKMIMGQHEENIKTLVNEFKEHDRRTLSELRMMTKSLEKSKKIKR
jgi:hypothetical protein